MIDESLIASLRVADDEAAALLRLETATAFAIGLAVIAAHVAYVIFILRWRKPLVVRGNPIRLPSPRLTAIQYVIGLIEVACMGGVLYVLLPSGRGPFLTVLGAFLAAQLLGLASHVPGARRRILDDEGHLSLVLRFDAILDDLLATSR